MSSNTIGILLCFLPLIMWGLSDYIGSLASKKISPLMTSLTWSIVGLPLAFLVCLFFGFPDITIELFGIFMLVALLLNTGFTLMILGYTKAATGLVTPIANSYAIFTLLFSVFFFGERFSLGQVLAMAVIISGVIMASMEFHEDIMKKRRALLGAFIAFAASLAFGGGFSLLGSISDRNTWYQNQFMLSITSVIVCTALVMMVEPKTAKAGLTTAKNMRLVYLGGTVGIIGAFGFYSGVQQLGNVVIPSVIASAAPLVTALLAHHRDHEKLQIQQRIGTVIIVGGVIFLNLI